MNYVAVVCDDEEDLMLIKEAFRLQPGEFAIKTFNAGDSLLDYLAQKADKELPCLFIINNYLPHMGSLQLLERLKGDPVYRIIPVAIMSGFDSQDAINDYYRSGANCFYRKPFDNHEWLHMADCLITLFCRS